MEDAFEHFCIFVRNVGLLRDTHEPLCDFVRWQDEIGGGRRCARHDVEPGAGRVLRERDSAGFPDGLQPRRSIRVVAGEDNADRAALLISRQRSKEAVQRPVRHFRCARIEAKNSL